MSVDTSLRERLTAVNLSPHRRAQAYHWLNAAVSAEQAGKAELAAHGFGRVAGLLAQAESAQAAQANKSSATAFTAWDRSFSEAGLASTRRMVERHGRRLTPMERKAYLDQLSDHPVGRIGFWALRRSISERLLRSRLNAMRPPLLKTKLAVFGEDMPVGPYNHRKTLEATLRLVEGIDSGWARDFLRTYTQGLTDIISSPMR
jgi:hypothetical protein